MALFDDASLVVTPNGYKEGTLYSIKPTSGAGDMTVVRATTATRVNSAGLIELVPYNLLTYSEQFNNADWSVQDATITANTTTAPNGTLTADTFTRTASTGFLYSTNPLSLNTGSYSHSFYAKANTISSFRLDLVTAGFSQGVTCVFDLSNGTAGTPILYGSASSFVATIENVGNGWYRCSLSGSIISGNYYAELAITTTGSIFIWGAQLNEGTIKDYLRTETRLNIPRLDYSNGTCPSILVEPQRSNELSYSQQFDNVLWLKLNASVTANDTISPSGIQDADKIVENTANDEHTIYRAIVGTSKTLSFYAKAAGRNWVAVLSNNGDYTFFNIANGTLGTIAATSTATIEDAENGWYRCTVYNTHPTFGAVINLATANGTTVYTGNGTSGIYLWGAQLEVGSYPTSYIPTTSAAVTRNADVISKTGISSLIGQTEGTLFIDLYRDNLASPFVFMIANSTGLNAYLNSIYMFQQANGTIVNDGFISGTLQFSFSTSGLSVGRHKLAIAYKQNDFVWYIDGSQVATDTSGNVPTFSAFEINGADISSNSNVKTNSVVLWKTRLTNSELISLTTL
jgi:hypothetical protein